MRNSVKNFLASHTLCPANRGVKILLGTLKESPWVTDLNSKILSEKTQHTGQSSAQTWVNKHHLERKPSCVHPDLIPLS